MIKPSQHTVKLDTVQYNTLGFDSVKGFESFVDMQSLKLTPSNKMVWDHTISQSQQHILRQDSWFGTPTPGSTKELEQHRVFSGMHLIPPVKRSIKKHLKKFTRFTSPEQIQIKQLDFNDRGLGVFSFDRAAMGLYRTPPLDRSSPIVLAKSQLKVALGINNAATKVKSVFAWFTPKTLSAPTANIFIIAGAPLHIEGNQIMYTGVGCSILVDFLELHGMPVQVFVIVASKINDQVVASIVKVKDTQTPINNNTLLLLSSDPKHFRYRGFKSIIAIGDYFQLNVPRSLGEMTKHLSSNIVKAIGLQGIVFQPSYSAEAVTNEILRLLEHFTSKKIPHE